MDNRQFEILPLQGEWGLGDVIGRIGSGVGALAGKVADVVTGSAGIIDLTAQADKSVRKGTRDMSKVKALVLHQMACCRQRKNPLTDYLKLKAHFAILVDGRILQLHPESALIWASNGFNAGSVAVEFAGNFPNTKGRWWEGDKFGRDHVTPAQLEAGRRLVRHLVATIGLRNVLAHRQSSASRENDPGPDIWHHVGQWAVDTLKLGDGGKGFKVGDGNAIPDLWRTWGTGAPAKEIGELGMAGETEGEQETVLGPLTARLDWLPTAYRYADVAARGSQFENFGGVYIAFVPGPGGKPQVLKVGMSDTFARRMRDAAYVAKNRKHPGLSFYLARVHGHRDKTGVAGVVRMVELALARLLRRGALLTGKQLPNKPTVTRGPVNIINALPPQLLALMPATLGLDGGQPYAGTMPPKNLSLTPGFRWEAEDIGIAR